MLKRTIASILLVGLLASVGLAQAPTMPPPDMLSAEATPQQVRAEVMAVHEIICNDIHNVAEILTKTGTLGKAIPIVIELTGMQPADIEGLEADVCRSDVSTLTFEELRFKNRQAVWLLDIHLVALNQVITAE